MRHRDVIHGKAKHGRFATRRHGVLSRRSFKKATARAETYCGRSFVVTHTRVSGTVTCKSCKKAIAAEKRRTIQRPKGAVY